MNTTESLLNRTAHKGLRALVGAAVALCAAGTVACAQAPPSFVVATIKPSPPDAQGQLIQMPPGRVSISNMTLQQLINFAYGNGAPGSALQITGGPAWIDKDRYTVQGEAEGMPSRDEMRLMLKNLLIERFALKTHSTSKEINVFNLVVARSDGKLGPKVEKWDGTCPGNRPPNPASPGAPRCGAFFTPTGLNMTGDSMAVLANLLSTPIAGLGRPVVDKTGLTDEYTYEFEYQFPRPNGPAVAGPPSNLGVPPDEPLPPALGTALQEQLGVKLQSAKGMAEVLIVDQAQRPSEN